MSSKLKSLALAGAALTLSSVALAQDVPQTAAQRLVPDMAPTIEVTSPNLLGANGEIDPRFSQYGANTSPELNWTAGPDGTASYAVFLEDPIAGMDFTILHWAVIDIPADVTALPEGVPEGMAVAGLGNTMQAPNIMGNMAYAGPRPPAGPAHTYHFQVFALDGDVMFPEDMNFAGIIEAMQGHVLAWGELAAPFTAPADAAPAGNANAGGNGGAGAGANPGAPAPAGN